MIRLFVPNDLSAGAGVVPTVDQSRYLTSVMRLSVGAELLLFNGRDGEWRATLVEATKRGCLLKAEEQTRPMTLGPDLDLIVAMHGEVLPFAATPSCCGEVVKPRALA